MAVEGRGGPLVPLFAEPSGHVLHVVFAVQLGDGERRAGRGESGGQGAQGGVVGAQGVVLLGRREGGVRFASARYSVPPS